MDTPLPRVSAVRTGNTVLVAIPGYGRPVMKQGEEGLELFKLVDLYRQAPDPVRLQDLVNALSAKKRFAYSADFDIGEDGLVYLRGSTAPIPDELKEFIDTMIGAGVSVRSIVNFWTLALANPDPRARNSFVQYVRKNGVTLTENGLAVLYKAVYIVKDEEKKSSMDSDLGAFVAKTLTEAHQKKKNPAKYYVYNASQEVAFGGKKYSGYFATFTDDAHKKYEGVQFVDTLANLVKKIDEGEIESEVVFTDMHTQQMRIKLNTVIYQHRDKCDLDPFKTCGRGLHVGSYGYVKNYGGNGKRGEVVILATLVNPANVLCAQEHSDGKMRVWEYFPFGVMETDEKGNWEELNPGAIETTYLAYERMSMLNRPDEIPIENRSVIIQHVSRIPFNNPTLEAIEVEEIEVEEGETRGHGGKKNRESKSLAISRSRTFSDGGYSAEEYYLDL